MPKINELLQEFCEQNEDCHFYNAYSGRCMFGRECVGITCSSPLNTLVKICEFLSLNEVEGLEDALGDVCMDNMGMDSIIYFQGVQPIQEIE